MLTRLLNLFLPTFLPLNANNARCSWTIYSMQNNIFIILVEVNGCSIAKHQTLWHKLATKNGKSIPKKIRNAEEIWLIFIFLAAAQPLLWYYFHRHIFGLEFFHVFTKLFARYAVLAFDDPNYLIICDVTMLQTRNNSNNTTKIYRASFETRWL